PVTGGSPSTGTVTLTAAAPSGGVVVNLQSSDSHAQVPSTTTVPAGQTSTNFPVQTSTVTTTTSATITGSEGGSSASTVLTINPGPKTPSSSPCVASVNLSANAVVGGTGLTGTVTLTAAAPAGGLVVNLQSSNPAVQVAATVTVRAGQTSAN